MNYYQDIIPKIQSALEDVGMFKAIFDYKADDFGDNGYPVAIFYPSDLGNEYKSTRENSLEFAFTLLLYMNSNGTDMKTLWRSSMPKLVDATIEKFNDTWDFGTIAGHRVRSLIEGGSWEEVTDDGGGLVFNSQIIIKLISTNNH